MALYHVFQRKFSELAKDSHMQRVRFVRKGYDKEINVLAKTVKEAHDRALHYQEKGEVKKVTEVWSVEFVLELDRV